MKPLTILSVAYPFAPVDADPVGGAEQVLAYLDRAVIASGGRSVVIAQAGSRPAGELVPIPTIQGELTGAARAVVHAEVRRRIEATAASIRPDLIHLHGIDFAEYLPPSGATPLLATLHLPLAWYPTHVLSGARRDLRLLPVSPDQVRRGPSGLPLLAPIENGVDVQAFAPVGRKHGFVLALGRICPEKGFHLALDAARSAGLPLILAGSVFPYAEHRRYFDAEIRPRLDARRRWIGPVAGEAKRRLIAAARCLVVASLAPETSSLVAREALAAGTPVAALRNGALADALEPGRTGVLADGPEGLADAMLQACRLDPHACRASALARFDLRRMTDTYLALYQRLARGEAVAPLNRLRPAA